MTEHKEGKSQVNNLYVFGLAFIAALGGLVYGYTNSALNSSYRIIEKVNDWPKESFRESLVVGLAPAGGIVGCITGGYIVVIGRRNLYLLLAVMMSLGLGLCLIGDYMCFVFGRFVQGMCVGYYTFVGPLFIREVSPPEIAGKLGAFFTLMARTGVLVTFLVCLLLPKVSVVKPNDQWWRIEIGFPFWVIVIQALFFLLFYLYETPKGCLLKNDTRQCMKMLREMYNSRDRALVEMKNVQKVLEESKGQEVTYSELFSPLFSRALLVASVLKSMQAFSGYTAVVMYSSSIFTDPNDEMAAIRGTVYVGVSNVCSVLLFSFIVDKFGRRNLLLAGTAAITVLNIVIGICMLAEMTSLSRFLVILFILCYSCSLGPVPWILAGELLPAKGVSLSVTFDWISTTIVSLAYKPVSAALGSAATFFIFAGFDLFTLTFSYFLVKETKGNTEMQNRLLYSPKEVREKRMRMLGLKDPQAESLSINQSFLTHPEQATSGSKS